MKKKQMEMNGMSIDNITVQEWNKMGFKTIKDEISKIKGLNDKLSISLFV